MFQLSKPQSILWIILGVFLSLSSMAAIIVVDNAGDLGELEGNCSLRDALLAASINVAVDSCTAGEAGVQDVVVVNVPGPIQLNSAIPVFGAVSIGTSLGANRVTIMAE